MMRFRIVFVALSVVALLAAGCGDDDDDAADLTTTTTEDVTTTSTEATTSTADTTEESTTTTQEPPASVAPPTTSGDEPIPDYIIEVPVEYIGQELDEAPEGGSSGYVTTESRSERSEAGFGDVPRVALMGDLVLAGQLPYPPGGAFPMQVTDGVRLISESPDVWLRIQCPTHDWTFAGEGVGAVAVMWRSPDGSERALQLWDYDPDQSRLVELDPATYEVGGCASNSRGAGS